MNLFPIKSKIFAFNLYLLATKSLEEMSFTLYWRERLWSRQNFLETFSTFTSISSFMVLIAGRGSSIYSFVNLLYNVVFLALRFQIDVSISLLLIFSINKIHNHINHHFLFFRFALSDHQCYCHQCIVSNFLCAIRFV